jgi:protein-S-isoprenylcysteine O-methyltransferase Ste14
MKLVFRHILGFAFGISVFLVLIPYGFFRLSFLDAELGYGISENVSFRIIISFPFFVLGLVFISWSNASLVFTGKGGPADGFNIPVSPRTKKLVTTGIYKYTRNPMMFGALTLYVSLGIFWNSLLTPVIIFVLYFVLIYYLKRTEEKRLLKDFGDEFTEYKSRTPVIIPDFLLMIKTVLRI